MLRLLNSRIGILLAAAACVWPADARSQLYSGAGNAHEVFVGTEIESYLRYLDLSDTTSTQSWLIRPLSPAQVGKLAQKLGESPWQARLAGFGNIPKRLDFALLSPNASVRVNSQFPYGS